MSKEPNVPPYVLKSPPDFGATYQQQPDTRFTKEYDRQRANGNGHPPSDGSTDQPAARRHESGIVILDFGKPSFHHGGYGTLLFSGRFAPNRKITRAMELVAAAKLRRPPKG